MKSNVVVGNRYKTTICKHFEQSGQCPLGAKCHFAHGKAELRSVNDPLPPGVPAMTMAPKPVLANANSAVNNHYRTSKCKYFDKGTCKFGSNCSFAHSDVEPKPFANSYPSPQGGSNGMHNNSMNHNNDKSIENEVAYHQIQFLASQMEDYHTNDKELLNQVKQANDLNKSNHVQDAASILYGIMNRSNKTKQDTDSYAMFVCKIQDYGTQMYQQLQSKQSASQGFGGSNSMGYNAGGNFGSYKQDFGSHGYLDKENSYGGQGSYGMSAGGHGYGGYSGGFGTH